MAGAARERAAWRQPARLPAAQSRPANCHPRRAPRTADPAAGWPAQRGGGSPAHYRWEPPPEDDQPLARRRCRTAAAKVRRMTDAHVIMVTVDATRTMEGR